MYSKRSPKVGLDLVVLAGLAFVGIIVANCGLTSGYPASIEPLSKSNKLSEKHPHSDQQAAEFRNFIHSKDSSDPTLIGELKPNASEMEMMVLRSKITSAILNMQEAEKDPSAQASGEQTGECFIEITKVERVPGKCHRVNNGLPVCQSENYMAINSECR